MWKTLTDRVSTGSLKPGLNYPGTVPGRCARPSPTRQSARVVVHVFSRPAATNGASASRPSLGERADDARNVECVQRRRREAKIMDSPSVGADGTCACACDNVRVCMVICGAQAFSSNQVCAVGSHIARPFIDARGVRVCVCGSFIDARGGVRVCGST